jgi:hypothetical protein
MEKNQPKKKFNAGAISVAIWENQGVSKTAGQTVSFNTVSLQRGYKDKEGNWKSTNNLRVADIPKAILVLQKAYEHLTLREFEATTQGSNEITNVSEEEIVM